MTNFKGDRVWDKYILKNVVLNDKRENGTTIKWSEQEMPCIKTLPIWRSTIESISGCNRDGLLVGNKKLGQWHYDYYKENKISTLKMFRVEGRKIKIKKLKIPRRNFNCVKIYFAHLVNIFFVIIWYIFIIFLLFFWR